MEPSEEAAQKEIDRRTGNGGLLVKYENGEWHAFQSVGVKENDSDIVPARMGSDTVARAATFGELLNRLDSGPR